MTELTITIPIPEEVKDTLDGLGWDYERNLIQQLKEAYEEILRCYEEHKKQEAE